MNKYVKKRIEVEALQIHGNVSEIKEFIGENGDAYTAGDLLDRPHTVVTIYTLEGIMRATDGDYIIKGVKGEFYPCRKDIFEETYESADLGRWITHPKGIYSHLVCDRCLSRAPYDCHTNYCPNCGQKMVKEVKDDNRKST